MWNKLFMLLLFFCIFQSASPQKSGKNETLTITGKVINGSNQPVSGAVIYIDNMKTSNITRDDGSFKVKVSSSAEKIEVRSSEFGNLEKAIEGKQNISFVLAGKGDTTMQVIPGQGKKHQKGRKMNTYQNIYQMIRAEVPGVIVNGSSIQIQQGHSFYGSSTPLFVVNGVIVSSIDNINPIEVKSIRVLKGSSAAIYGVRGSNGVLTIQLINGSERKE